MTMSDPIADMLTRIRKRPLALAVKGSAEDSVPLDYAALPETILLRIITYRSC